MKYVNARDPPGTSEDVVGLIEREEIPVELDEPLPHPARPANRPHVVDNKSLRVKFISVPSVNGSGVLVILVGELTYRVCLTCWK